MIGLILATSIVGNIQASDAKLPPDKWTSEERRIAAMDDTTFDAQYKCPEMYTSDEAKQGEAQTFLFWIETRHGAWTLKDALNYRYGMFEKHHCVVTLRNIEENDGVPAHQP
jgi:hypothetical protein